MIWIVLIMVGLFVLGVIVGSLLSWAATRSGYRMGRSAAGYPVITPVEPGEMPDDDMFEEWMHPQEPEDPKKIIPTVRGES